MSDTLTIDESRFTISTSFDEVGQKYFANGAEWDAFTADVNNRGDSHARENARIAEKLNPGAWCCCLCLCCICGPCIFMWRMGKVAQEVMAEAQEEQNLYETAMRNCVSDWTEKASGPTKPSIKLDYEDRQVQNDKGETTTKRYYKLTLTPQ